jgi:nucleotide-binding universal stress UspA family protein
MYQRVLLAYDGSREGRSALREGALMAHRFGAKVFLLCVVPEMAGGRLAEGGASVAGAQEAYRELFDEAVGWMTAAGFDLTGQIATGEPAQQISVYARRFEADLVVVGHRKRSLLERWWSGTTGAYLVDHLQCSLLVSRRAISDEEFMAAMAGDSVAVR